MQPETTSAINTGGSLHEPGRHGRGEATGPDGLAAPDPDRYPNGAEWVERYLQPLAEALGEGCATGARVIGVARRGRDRVVDAGRDSEPLTVHVATGCGEERILARSVIDASGTWTRRTRWVATGCPRSENGPPVTGSRYGFRT